MAQLYFYYSAMNAGKSTSLLQSAYNYQERGMSVALFTVDFDNRFVRNGRLDDVAVIVMDYLSRLPELYYLERLR